MHIILKQKPCMGVLYFAIHDGVTVDSCYCNVALRIYCFCRSSCSVW